ncbi:MAG TPA: hypothetical protein VHF45_09565 [Thermoleophilaceae bacterium]|nr:hypothetical protein [Thermoleophilaceae bacterium]
MLRTGRHGGDWDRAVVPAVARLGPWARWPGRWGGARAGWIPGEMDSRGRAFQRHGRWSEPDAWARAARPCTYDRCDERGECDGRETAITIATPLIPALTVPALLRRRSSRHAEYPEP